MEMRRFASAAICLKVPDGALGGATSDLQSSYAHLFFFSPGHKVPLIALRGILSSPGSHSLSLSPIKRLQRSHVCRARFERRAEPTLIT